MHHSARRPGAWFLIAAACAMAAVSGIGAQGNAVETARNYIERNRPSLGLTGSDTAEMVVSSTVRDDHSGVTHVYFQQRYRSIGVFNAILNVSVTASGTVVAVGNRFVPNLAAAAGGQQPGRAHPRGILGTAAANQPR